MEHSAFLPKLQAIALDWYSFAEQSYRALVAIAVLDVGL